MKQREENQR